MRTPRRARKVFSIFGAVFLLALLPMAPSSAQVDCDKHELFVYDNNTGYGVTGTRAVHKPRAPLLSSQCQDIMVQNMRQWSTAHVRSLTWSHWVEVGWSRVNQVTNKWITFAEYRRNSDGAVVYTPGPAIPCTSNCLWSVSKVLYLSSTAKWYFYFDYGNDGTWQQVRSPVNIGWTTGFTFSEASMCCNTQNIYDHFDALMFTTAGVDQLYSWATNAYGAGSLPNNCYHYIAADEWDAPAC